MKNYLIRFSIVLLFSTVSHIVAVAQQVRFSELVSFFEGGPAVAQQVLFPRGWVHAGFDTFQDSVQHCAGKSYLYGFPLTPPDSTGYGQWINVDTEGTCPQVVGYQTNKQAAIELMRRELKSQYRMALDKNYPTWAGRRRVTHSVYVGPVYRAQVIEEIEKVSKVALSARYTVYVGKLL
ncbi:hypothetical protein [Hymenobacter pini]|uniref:hypothetical protein n=1 Tax=Hymenobacter pini TaxID=2880879 RepID=UPI001CF516F0|nr:hypothetical protein [Hymenobacter pini]MCA8829747.1 hypothetical protein [Hymenobacter pini]